MSDHRSAAAVIDTWLGGRTPRVALLLGSGLASVTDRLTDSRAIPYRDLPGFPTPSVAGHQGRLLSGELNKAPVLCLQGRVHHYEGHPPAAMALPIRALRAAGCDTLIVTNAAGSLRPELGPGGLMTITDHINWAGVNPLAGPNDGELGPRFPDMTEAYDPALRIELHEAARAAGVELREGVYLMYPGPNFETPAEIRAFAALGADATGMSTVPECLVANHCGMRVAAISVITNLAAGIGGHCLSHQDTLATAQAAAGRLGELLFRFLPRIAP